MVRYAVMAERTDGVIEIHGVIGSQSSVIRVRTVRISLTALHYQGNGCLCRDLLVGKRYSFNTNKSKNVPYDWRRRSCSEKMKTDPIIRLAQQSYARWSIDKDGKEIVLNQLLVERGGFLVRLSRTLSS